MAKRMMRPLLVLLLTAALAAPARAQHRVTTPEQQFGHQIGDDYWLMNYRQLHDYWIKLAHESDRMVLDTIGTTSEGRPQIMAIISSPQNIKNLERYREIAHRLAKAEGVTEAQARQLAQEGKAVVWIDGGLHATEVLGAEQLCELVYRLNDYTDPETTRILNDVIVLAVHANPDGMDLVSNWYMREPDPAEAIHERDSGPVQQVRGPRRQPRLLHVGVGGDDQPPPRHGSRVVSRRSCTTTTRRVPPVP